MVTKTYRILTENCYNSACRRDMSPILAPNNRSCIVNTQIGVGHSKNVIVFDPLLTGQVIRRMRSGRVRIFNGNKRETL